MEYETFRRLFEKLLPIGAELLNPGGGTTTIISYGSDSVAYKRGKSTMRPSIKSFFDMYKKYSGHTVSSRDLKSELPAVFDSSARPAGHSCNCTFFFQALQRMGLAGQLSGKGVSGSPYAVSVGIGERV